MWTILPSNGLDRSLHPAVLIGVLVVTFFAETLGWTFAGLVVPGFLAAVFLAAPVTALCMVVESLAVHAVVATLGSWIPTKTGAWSTTFGRERFFLYVVVAVIVRLAMEAIAIPWMVNRWNLPHARELYSIGLVIVPLTANMLWNAGAVRSIPRLAVMVAVSYVLVDLILLRNTNYSLSGFQITHESVALGFLDTPKAYMILLVGALLAARGNVLHGWDYNGILVPALLGLAWYEPIKLGASIGESVVVYLLCRWLTTIPPLSRVPMVGPRRLAFAVAVGFGLKLVLGFLIQHFAPSVVMIDFLGFGYILPALLATKMWNKEEIGVVIMPTLQVSLTAFVLGNLVGFGFHWFTERRESTSRPTESSSSEHQASFELLLADTVPTTADSLRNNRRSVPAKELATASVRFLTENNAQAFSQSNLGGLLDIRRCNDDWVVVTAKRSSDEDNEPGPRVALQKRHDSTQRLLLVPHVEQTASPAVPLAVQLAPGLSAMGVSVLSSQATAHQYDRALLRELVTELNAHWMVLELVDRPGVTFEIIGEVPTGVDVPQLEKLLGTPITILFASKSNWWNDKPAPIGKLRINRKLAQSAAANALATPASATWSDRLDDLNARLPGLTTTGQQGYRGPSLNELRLFRTVVGPAVLTQTAQEAWPQAVASKLGFAIASTDQGLTLFEPEGANRRGLPTWHVRPTPNPATFVEIPAPRWEQGTFLSAMALAEATQAKSWLVAGAMPPACPAGCADPRRIESRRSYFQAAHELLLEAGWRGLSTQGIPAQSLSKHEIVLSTGSHMSEHESAEWERDLRSLLQRSGFQVGTADATEANRGLEANGDPTVAYAERFAPGRFMVVRLSTSLRTEFSSRLHSRSQVEALATSLPYSETNAAQNIWNQRVSHPRARLDSRCALASLQQLGTKVLTERNPFDRKRLADLAHACSGQLLLDQGSATVWLSAQVTEGTLAIPLNSDRARVEPRTVRSPQELGEAIALASSFVLIEVPR